MNTNAKRKFSGAENRKKKREKEKEESQLSKALAKYLRRDMSGESTTSVTDPTEHIKMDYSCNETNVIKDKAVVTVSDSLEHKRTDSCNEMQDKNKAGANTVGDTLNLHSDKRDISISPFGPETTDEIDTNKIELSEQTGREDFDKPSTSRCGNLNEADPVNIMNINNTSDTSFVSAKNQPSHIPPWKDEKRTHNFLLKWFREYPWLHFSEELQGVVCFECTEATRKKLLSQSSKSESKLSNGEGLRNWKKADSKFMNHEKSQIHKEAVMKIHSLRLNPVIVQLGMVSEVQQHDASKALEAIFKSLLYLSRQGLALRGHNDSSGNFLQLLTLMSQYIPELANFLKKKKSFTSPSIQNEMTKTAAHFILRQIVSKIQEAEYFSIIVDETADISGHEQVSISIRTVLPDFSVEEQFLGLYETASLTGEAIFDLIRDALCRFNLSLENLRGQCYDGGSNMSGINKGVQKRMLDLQPLATYVHCSNHSLNLALQDSVRAVSLIRDCMQWVNDVGVLIRHSPKRRGRFEEIVKEKESTTISTPRILCPTRWCVRTAALDTVLKAYPYILEMLGEIASCKDSGSEAASKARGLSDQLSKGEVYLGVAICRRVFGPSERLATALQAPSMTCSAATEAVEATKAQFMKYRTDEMFDELWQDMEEKVESYELEPPKLPRKRFIPRTLEHSKSASENFNFTLPKDRLKVMYYETLDTLIGEIEDRFKQPGFERVKSMEEALLLDPKKWCATTESILDMYQINVPRFKSQVSVMANLVRVPAMNSLKEMVEGLRSVHKETRELFPEVIKVLHLLLVIPATSATAERSFSLLKRLKSYLRSTMSQNRLNHLAILHCYKDVVDEIDVKELCREFCCNQYRVSVFGKEF